ncbi:MAG: glycosyltransferase family 2 protein [Gammaproteobacteria bacterium]|nr:glycosyltransferase family 2 protein [Gammaproteobacteria bacterium]
MDENVYGVVVCYRRDPEAIMQRLRALNAEAAGVIAVDNSQPAPEDAWARIASRYATLHVILNGHNLGVGKALNQGIAAALERGASLVLLLDDDSEPAAGMLQAQLAALRALRGAGGKVAAIGADYTSHPLSRRTLYPQFLGMRVRRVGCSGVGTLPVEYMMTSGSLIPAEALGRIGPMREDFFIDCIDTEWCFRARAAGYGLFVACAAKLEHSPGEGALFGCRLAYRKPLRQYFAFRNSVYTLRLAHCPWPWRLMQTCRLFGMAGAYLLFARDRWRQLGMMAKGAWHGLRGQLGAPDDPDHGEAIRS